MPTILPDMSIQQFQLFVKEVYEKPNLRFYEIAEMLNNIQRFSMRGLKGLRKSDADKTKRNLMISFSWFVSTLVRLRIDLGEEVWKRFPYVCSYCNTCPCKCKVEKIKERQHIIINSDKKPKTLSAYQKMFSEIYPAPSRSIEHAGVHLAEELGEFLEAFWAYRTDRKKEDFKKLKTEAADYFSCLIGVCNSINIDLAKELALFFPHNCHECREAPCICSFEKVKNFAS